jgi:ATP-dependent Clp protease ATP-binding subunit ClpC
MSESNSPTWSPFERFTILARRAVVAGAAQARSMGHGYFGAEHLLLGLLLAEGGVAQLALSALGVTSEGARSEVQSRVGRGFGREGLQPLPDGRPPFTPRMKRVLAQAVLEAGWLEHDKHVGTEHLLLGLVGEGTGTTAEVLNGAGATPGRVREEVMKRIRRGYTPEYLTRYGSAPRVPPTTPEPSTQQRPPT